MLEISLDMTKADISAATIFLPKCPQKEQAYKVNCILFFFFFVIFSVHSFYYLELNNAFLFSLEVE